jgi:hypothetical protein
MQKACCLRAGEVISKKPLSAIELQTVKEVLEQKGFYKIVPGVNAH